MKITENLDFFFLKLHVEFFFLLWKQTNDFVLGLFVTLKVNNGNIRRQISKNY